MGVGYRGGLATMRQTQGSGGWADGRTATCRGATLGVAFAHPHRPAVHHHGQCQPHHLQRERERQRKCPCTGATQGQSSVDRRIRREQCKVLSEAKCRGYSAALYRGHSAVQRLDTEGTVQNVETGYREYSAVYRDTCCSFIFLGVADCRCPGLAHICHHNEVVPIFSVPVPHWI